MNSVRTTGQNLLLAVVGRRLLQRIGRFLYMLGRGEQGGDMLINGEHYVQSCVVAACASPGPVTVFDVGGNVGDWSELLIKAFPNNDLSALRLFVFEPTPATREGLAIRLAPYRDGSITISPIALSEASGPARFAVMSESSGTNSLAYDAMSLTDALDMLDVETLTLDDFCSSRGVERINLIKTDTEGHDFSILKGAKGMLQAGRIDVYQFEYNHMWAYSHAFLRDVFLLIRETPYRLARMMPGHIELVDEWHPELDRFMAGNYLLLHPGALEWLDARPGSFDASNTFASVSGRLDRPSRIVAAEG